MRRTSRALVQIALISVGCGVLHAAELDAVYLKPAGFYITAGRPVQVRASQGSGIQVRSVPWPTDQINWLFIRATNSQENREDVGPRDAGSDFIEITVNKPGVALVGLDAKPDLQSWSAAELDPFLKRNLTTEAYQEFTARAKEKSVWKIRRVQYAKTLVRIADADAQSPAPSSVAMSKTGQIAELRAMIDPTLALVGGDLPLRTYVDCDALGGVKVLAACVATGKTQEALCDKAGFANIRIDSTGEWRVEFHAWRPPPDESCDGALYSATLTFEVTRTEAGK